MGELNEDSMAVQFNLEMIVVEIRNMTDPKQISQYIRDVWVDLDQRSRYLLFAFAIMDLTQLWPASLEGTDDQADSL